MPPLEDQYHHYIPRFILRHFKLPTPQCKNGRKRRSQRRESYNQEMVYYYDLATGALEIRPIAKVYGTVNLYKDVKNLENIYHLEGKLSILENQAAKVIRTIHNSMDRGSFQIQRRDLDALRKFIQIMYYRRHTFYFDEDHPDNIPGAGFLKCLRESKGLDSAVEMWLHFLDYLLNTPHHELIKRATAFQEKDDTSGISMTLQSIFTSSLPTNTTAEDFIANDYNHLADHFYLGIVQAAPGTEFIVSDNAFGIWEGIVLDQVSDAHRLFIVSPRIALILRSNVLREELQFSHPPLVRSSLIDIPLPIVEIRYANGHQDMTMEELVHYRATPVGQRDEVNFKIMKLTEQQTQNVNTLILVNATTDGSITFLSKDMMRKTLENYMNLNHPFITKTKRGYIALMDQLAKPDDRTQSDRSIGPNSHFSYQSPALDGNRTCLLQLEATLSEILSKEGHMNNKRINVCLDDISSGKITCQSDYDRAYQIYRVASKEEDAGQYVLTVARMLLPIVVGKVLMSKGEAIESPNGVIQANFFGELVETLPVSQSVTVMSTVKALIASASVPPYPDPEINDALYNAIIVGLLDCVVREATFALLALFPGTSLLR